MWDAARRQKLDAYFVPDSTQIEDDHLPFLAAGVPSVDIIDLEYEPWHTAKDTLDAVSARSLQIVGDVVLAALPQIEARVASPPADKTSHEDPKGKKTHETHGLGFWLATSRRTSTLTNLTKCLAWNILGTVRRPSAEDAESL